MKAAPVRVKTFAEDTPGALDVAITAFLATLAEAEYHGLAFAVSVATAVGVDSSDVATTSTVTKYCAQLTYTQ
jgi:hypothetical protein